MVACDQLYPQGVFFGLNIMKTELVTVTNGVASTTSLVIADLFNRPHDNVLKSLDKIKDSVGFNAISYIDSMNRPKRAYALTEREALISMPFIGGLKSIEGQIKLVNEFLAMRNHIAETSTVEKRLSNLESELAALKRVDSLPSLSFQEQAKKVIERYIEKHKNEKLTARQIALGLREAKPFKNNGGYKAVKSTLVTISVLM